MRLLAPIVSVLAVLAATHVALAEGVVRPEPARAPVPIAPEERAPGLSPQEAEHLLSGGVVARKVEFDRPQGRYVGAVSYVLIDADATQALSELSRVKHLPVVLPRTRKAKLVDDNRAGARVRLTQGNDWFDATYSILMVQETDQVSFWLDENSPSDIDDVFGYFRVVPFGEGKALATVAVAVDVGSVLFRGFIEERVVQAILATPERIRRFVEPRAFLAAR